ncbi:hypothetical protein IW261DRAFT_947396 [Armillaria novae-zelandiae]|uniref:Uncharacterized protein n=1 Tax=Armillaria novae-zelandiae TaxID=153914 RepID=A0AA39PFT6_9AGAR|nr:hypothetical protein IW261DRAFT_947396 [Armillaria novae-zelandiae]
MSSPFRKARRRSNTNGLRKPQQADVALLEGISKYRILRFGKGDTSRRSSLARYRLLRAYMVRHNLQPRRIRDLVSIAAYYDNACFPVTSSESPISPITVPWKYLTLGASPERTYMKKAPNSTSSPPSSPTCITAASMSRMRLASNRPVLRSRPSFMAVSEPVLYTAASPAVPFSSIDSSHCSTPVTPDQQVLPMPFYPLSPLRTRAQPEKPRKFSSLWTCSPASRPASVSRSVRRRICDDTPIESLTECISLLSTQDHFSMVPRRLSYSRTTLSLFRPLRKLSSHSTQNLQSPVLIHPSNTLESSRCFPFVGAAASRYH